MLEADGSLDALDAHRRQLVREPDVPVPRRGAGRGDGRDVPRRPEDRHQARSAGQFFKEYPFEEAYFLPYARQFRAALSMPLVLLGGINRLDTVTQALDDGFAFVQIGRALLREPELLARDAEGPAARVAVHPLQQVHADDLHRHPLRARRDGLNATSRRPRSRVGEISRYSSRFWCRLTMRHSSVGETVRCGQAGLVQAALTAAEVREVLIEDEADRELLVGRELDVDRLRLAARGRRARPARTRTRPCTRRRASRPDASARPASCRRTPAPSRSGRGCTATCRGAARRRARRTSRGRRRAPRSRTISAIAPRTVPPGGTSGAGPASRCASLPTRTPITSTNASHTC